MKVKFTTVSERVCLDSLEKYLSRNDDALLVKLEGERDQSMIYKPGHVCGIEADDEDPQKYNVFVGKHKIGYFPQEALDFANSVDEIPEVLPTIVGKVEEDNIYVYIAE